MGSSQRSGTVAAGPSGVIYLGVAWSHGFEVDVLARKLTPSAAVTALAQLEVTGPESLFERRIGQAISSDHGQPVLRVISPADSPDALGPIAAMFGIAISTETASQ